MRADKDRACTVAELIETLKTCLPGAMVVLDGCCLNRANGKVTVDKAFRFWDERDEVDLPIWQTGVAVILSRCDRD